MAIGSAAEAQRLGIAAIYQEPMVFPDLDVAENIFIGHRTGARSSAAQDAPRGASAILAELGMALDVAQPGARA